MSDTTLRRVGIGLLWAAAAAHAATVPIGPPESHLGDSWPTPRRTLWVDRCGRGAAGVCGAVTCADSNACTSQNAPCCTLARANQVAQAGDLVNVRAGASGGLDGYWEVDNLDARWGIATLSPRAKGTARCAAGANAGWGCTSDAGCPGSTCDYRPIVWYAYREADGSRAHIDPMGNHPPSFGATNCNGGIAGRYIGVNFMDPACLNPANDRLECYGGTQEGKPCSGDGDCGGGGQCGNNPWYTVFDGFAFTNWNYWDARTDIDDSQNVCSEKAFNVERRYCPTPVSVTVQNSTFTANGGAGVLWAQGAAGMRWFHNTFRDNLTRGYTTQVNHWEAQDQTRNRVTYMWGNDIGNGADYVPNWAHGGARWWDGGAISVCLPPNPSTPPTFTCLDGPNTGQPCHGEGLAEACGYGHCGGMCKFDISYNGNPTGQGYQCECTAPSQCQTGLTCQVSRGSGPSGNTEGRGIIIDRGSNSSAVDLRNNVIWGNQGDCISHFLGDSGSAAKGHGAISNNTCFHNAEKGASYGELNLLTRYLDVYNNLLAPSPFGSCKGGAKAGQVCTDYGQHGQCGDGFGCEVPTYYQYDNVDLFSGGLYYGNDRNAFGGTTVSSDRNLFWVPLPGLTTNPRSFEYAAPGSGETRNASLDDYRSYGSARGLTRDQNSIVGDPLFASTDPREPGFLKPMPGSPALGAGDSTKAPPFDIEGNPRDPLAPTIGAYELPVDPGNTTPTTTTVQQTTTTASPPTSTSTMAPPTTTPTTTTPPTTIPPGAAVSIWPGNPVPALVDAATDGPVELGVKFRSDVAGYVTGLRFYKSTANTGTHIGNLWTGTGTRLGTVTFTGETAAGWQQATFPTPVPIEANVVYVASYFCPAGHYSGTRDYFASQGADAPPLHAPASADVGGNGVFVYASTSAFPTRTYQALNYWVDVVVVGFAAPTTSTTLSPTTTLPPTTTTTTPTTTTTTGSPPTTTSSSTTTLATTSTTTTTLPPGCFRATICPDPSQPAATTTTTLPGATLPAGCYRALICAESGSG